MKSRQEIAVPPEAKGRRIDAWLATRYPQISRSRIQQLLKAGEIILEGSFPIKPNYRLKGGETIRINLPQPSRLEVKPEPIPLDILYEDQDIIVINKPRGMVVHPAPGSIHGTLANALRYYCRHLSDINGFLRPGIVHRLDKDTTGVLVAAKNNRAHLCLAEQIKARGVKREYLSLVHGTIAEPQGRIEAPIGRHPINRQRMAVTLKNSRAAFTYYQVLEVFKKYTFLRIRLETGRTHQIRVHMAYMGYPVVGDAKYGLRKCPFKLEGQLLHAHCLGFIHPRQREYLEFTAPLPDVFQKILTQLRQLQKKESKRNVFYMDNRGS